MAWLHAKPERDDKKAPAVSRLVMLANKARLGAEVPELDPPPIDAGGHMVEYLFEAGPSVAGETLSFSEIESWSAMTGTMLSAWECQALRNLSAAYLSELQQAADPARPVPQPDADD